MYKKVLSILTAYVNWIKITYKAILEVNASVPNLRLVLHERDKKSGDVNFVIQISGKNIFPKLSLHDLASPSLLSNFSKKDQKIICSFLSRDDEKPEKRISARTYDRNKKQFIFTIQSSDQKKNLTIDDLSHLMKDLHSFDKDDSTLISLESDNHAS